MSDLLIEADALRHVLAQPDWLVFDVRYNLTDPNAGEQAYLDGHIPGAQYLDQGTQLAGQTTGKNGRHPLPDAHTLTQRLRQLALTPESKVVVYDHNDGSFAARAWWLLRWVGCSHVRILNGGLQAWQDAGGRLQSSQSVSSFSAVQTQGDMKTVMPTVSAADILSHQPTDGQVLIDARTAERYRGDVEPLDPVAGRIDGALNRPIANNLQPDGRFKPASQLHDEFTTLLGNQSAQQVIHYCGSGLTACHNVFAMELAGLSGSALYPGSWSEWCSDPNRPIAKG